MSILFAVDDLRVVVPFTQILWVDDFNPFLHYPEAEKIALQWIRTTHSHCFAVAGLPFRRIQLRFDLGDLCLVVLHFGL